MNLKKIEVPGWLRPNQKVKCWIQIPHSPDQPFRKAIYQDLNQFSFKARCLLEDLSSTQIKLSNLHQRSGQSSSLQDLIDLQILNEAQLLHYIRQRFNKSKIFTYIGPTLLVVNPFSYNKQLYSQKVMNQYYESLITTQPSLDHKIQPHIYSIAGNAIRMIIKKHRNQSIVISGESGAGKTQTNKHCMKFIAAVCKGKKGQLLEIQEKILSCNPILQSFGNAKTARNDNSSRFGKYVRLYIDPSERKIKGAKISNYLLQKSRLVCGQGQANFHVLYSVVKNARYFDKKYMIFPPYKFLPKNQAQIPSYQQLRKALNTLDINEDTLLRIISSVLMMGNIQFDQSTLSDDQPCQVQGGQGLVQLLQISKQILRALVQIKLVVGKTTIIKPLKKKQCIENRDNLAKAIYQRLFSWLIVKLNERLKPDKHQNTIILGLLDIYGFQVFKVNSFQQLCINYTNQRLQQLYINQVFKEEKRIFQREGLDKFSRQTIYSDNQPILQLLDLDVTSVFNLLDQACKVACPDQSYFLNKIRNVAKDHPNFPKTNKNLLKTFIIKHTPKQIEYTALNFRQKNKDYFREDLINVLSQSANKDIANLFKLQQFVKSQSALSLNRKFRKEISELTAELSNQTTDVHFIRCIKSNQQRKAMQFVNGLALTQIKYLGILDTIRIRKEGYSVRIDHQQFYQAYGFISMYPPYKLVKNNKNINLRQCVQGILDSCFPQLQAKAVLIGKSKVFMRDGTIQIIKTIYSRKAAIKMQKIIIIQKNIKGYLARSRYNDFRKHTIILQSKLKSLAALSRFQRLLRATIYIQNWYINYKNRIQLKEVRWSVMIMQKIMKTKYYSLQFSIQRQAALIIQDSIRNFLAKKKTRIYTFCRHIVLDSLSQAWNQIVYYNIQNLPKYFRHLLFLKKQKRNLVKINLKISLKSFNRLFKGLIVQRQLKKKNQAAYKIQSFVKMKWLVEILGRLKHSSRIIQKAWRKFYYKKQAQRQTLNQFYRPFISKLGTQKLQFNNFLFGGKKNPFNQALAEDHQTIYKKCHLFLVPLDVEPLVILDDIYPDSAWLKIFRKLFTDGFQKGNWIQSITVGQCHTLAINCNGKVYSWGSNDYFQLGSYRQDQSTQKAFNIELPPNSRAVQILAFCDESSITLNTSESPYRFGKLQKDRQTSTFQQYSLNNKFKIEKGELFQWSLVMWKQIYFQKKEKVLGLACGAGHVCILTNLKKVYTWGWGEKGQLGNGKFYNCDKPKSLDLSQMGPIIQINAAYTSTILMNQRRKIYWCGTNSDIQLQPHFSQIRLPQKFQAFIDTSRFQPLKLICSWSKTISFTGVVMVYVRGPLKQNSTLRNRVLNQLIKKWLVQCPRSIDPPFDQSISKYFSQKNMKMPVRAIRIQPQSKLKHQALKEQLRNLQSKRKQDQNNLQFSFTDHEYF